MALDRDCQYILSLGQRLVEKYQENPEIIDEIMSIIKRFTVLKNSYINNTKIATSSIQEINKYLNGIHTTLINNHKNLTDNILIKPKKDPTTNSQKAPLDFDSLDIDSILGTK